MQIILSPAKTMKVNMDSSLAMSTPQFLQDTQQILQCLRGMSRESLQKLWKCNNALLEENIQRIQTMDLLQGQMPAILAYQGIQYQHMAANEWGTAEIKYLQNHVRILSGFYGLLRPLDGIVPYRLEMQAKLSIGTYKDIYAFWGSRLAELLAAESACVLNLASKEYSKAVQAYLPSSITFITCRFVEQKQEKLVEKSTFCKMLRGQLVHWMAEHQITELEDVQKFASMGYRFHRELSCDTEYVFVKE